MIYNNETPRSEERYTRVEQARVQDLAEIRNTPCHESGANYVVTLQPKSYTLYFTRVNHTLASNIQNSTTEASRTSLTSQYLSAEEEAKHTMGGSRSSSDDSTACGRSELEPLAACVPRP